MFTVSFVKMVDISITVGMAEATHEVKVEYVYHPAISEGRLSPSEPANVSILGLSFPEDLLSPRQYEELREIVLELHEGQFNQMEDV